MTKRALVLGGGGVTGVAWELGMLAGLAERGADLTGADLIVGTSAGSVVGADITASDARLPDLYAAQLRPPLGETAARMGIRLIASYSWAMLRPGGFAARMRRVGRLAITAPTQSEADRRAVIAARLPGYRWDAARLLITAVDAESGEFGVFDAASGIDLVDAVGASCAVPGVWPPVTIRGRRWMDGGMRSPANADLAAGHDRVVIIAPLTLGLGPRTRVAGQAARLRAAGAAVAVISPDAAARKAIGGNALDPARRAPAARAGHAQAAAEAARIAGLWARPAAV